MYGNVVDHVDRDGQYWYKADHPADGISPLWVLVVVVGDGGMDGHVKDGYTLMEQRGEHNCTDEPG